MIIDIIHSRMSCRWKPKPDIDGFALVRFNNLIAKYGAGKAGGDSDLWAEIVANKLEEHFECKENYER